MANFVDKEIARIRNLVGEKGQVLGAVSGGVDSTVAAKLMHEAIGDRFKAVLVDHGFMRLNEREQVEKDLRVFAFRTCSSFRTTYVEECSVLMF